MRWLCVVLLVALIPVTAQSDERSQGIEAFKAKDYPKALALLKPAAEEGDPAAQFYLAQMFEQGLGVEAEFKAAAEWYRRSALGYGAAMDSAFAKAGQQHEQLANDCESRLQFLYQENQELRDTIDRIRREIGRAL